MKIKSVFFCFGIVLSLQAPAQEIPLGILPMQYNGGFAGEGEKARFVIGGGLRSYNSGERGNNYFGSYDQFFPKLRSGIGVTISGFQWASSFNSQTIGAGDNSLMLSFSPKFSYKGRHTFAPFIDWSISHNDRPTDFSQPAVRKEFFVNKVRVGVLYNSRKLYAGITYYAISKISGKDLPPFFYRRNYSIDLQAGYTFQKLPESKFSLTPHLIIFLGYDTYFDRPLAINFNFNLMFRYQKFLWSLNNTRWSLNSTGLGLGYQNSNFRILLSQNLIFFTKKSKESVLSLRYILK